MKKNAIEHTRLLVLSLLAELSREEGELWEKPPEKQEGKGPLEFTALMQRLREKK